MPIRTDNVCRPTRRIRSAFLLALVCLLATGCGVYGWPYTTRPHTYAVALGDLDLFAGLLDDQVRAWFNDGRGQFKE